MKGSEIGNSGGWNGAVTRPDTLKERGRNVKPLKGCERASNTLAVRKRLQHRRGVGEKCLVLPADAQQRHAPWSGRKRKVRRCSGHRAAGRGRFSGLRAD